MMDTSPLDGRSGAATIAITDSGLGGLLICAELERRLRGTEGNGSFRLVYVNAWPETGRGYNDLPDLSARALVFDRALAAMMDLRPNVVLIACNTLSVVYEATAFGRTPPRQKSSFTSAHFSYNMSFTYKISAGYLVQGPSGCFLRKEL